MSSKKQMLFINQATLYGNVIPAYVSIEEDRKEEQHPKTSPGQFYLHSFSERCRDIPLTNYGVEISTKSTYNEEKTEN